MSAVGNTNFVAESSRFDYFHDLTCRNYSVTECKALLAQPFEGKLSIAQFGAIQLGDVASSCLHYDRGPQEIRKDPRDNFVILLLAQGGGRIAQDGRETDIHAGDLMMYHQARPFKLELIGGYRTFAVSIPTSLLRHRLPDAERLTARCLHSESKLGTLAGSVLRQLIHIETDENPAIAARLSESAIDILATALEVELSGSTGWHSRHAKLLDRVKRYMLANLQDSEMNLERISIQQNISPRTLYRLFAAQGTTPIRWLWQQRLEASHRILAKGEVEQVKDAAMSLGFNDLSHFSRAFKRTFGISPHSLIKR